MSSNSQEKRKIKTIVVYTLNGWGGPLPVLRVTGPAQKAGLQIIKGNKWKNIWPEKVSQADIVVIQRDFPRHVEAYDAIITRARVEGKPVIYDIDDLILELPASHPDRQVNYYTDALFPALRAIVEADAVTTSTPALLAYLRPFNPRVHLLPNYIHDDLWPLSETQVRASQPLVVGYMGGGSHEPDLEIIAPVLLEIVEQHEGRVQLKFWGSKPPAALLSHPHAVWETPEVFDYAEFARYFQQQHCDIFVAPLVDDFFNRHKSAIKFLEYSARGIPGVYSRVAPYKGVVVEGVNGLLAGTAEEWRTALERLIADETLRRSIGRRAQETIRAHWMLSAHAHKWAEVYAAAQPNIPMQETGRVIAHMSGEVHAWQRSLEAQVMQKSSEIQTLTTRLEKAEEAQKALANQLTAVKRRASQESSIPGRRFERALLFPWRVWKRARGQRRTEMPEVAAKPTLPPPVRSTPPASHTSKVTILREPATLSVPPPSTYDLIIFPIIHWDFRFQRPQHLAMQFARQGHRVFYLHAKFHRAAQPTVVVKEIEERVYEVCVSGPPEVRIYKDAMDGPLRKKLVAAIAALQVEFEMHNVVLKVDFPFWGPAALALRTRFGWPLMYDCMDDHSSFSTNTPQMLAHELPLIRASDLTLATSRRLFGKVSAESERCLRVPNAAEFEHFRFRPATVPDEMRWLKSPVIGFYGAISERFDTELLAELAQARPQWLFVLIGSMWTGDVEALKGLENVHLLGEKPYAQLPGYLHAFDVCILPFKKTPLIEATNPVKFFEYLSAGKPVVATEWGEMLEYAEHVRLVRTRGDWLPTLEAALADTSPERIYARYDFARQHTWEARAAQMKDEMLTLFPKASIVVLTYNNVDYTRLCLESIFARTVYPHFEVIVVDNASTDGTREFLEAFAAQHPVQLIFNARNKGFAGGNNIGMQAATGDFLVYLNNDTLVTRGWLAGLLGRLRDPAVGMVGPVTNSAANESQIAVPYNHQRDIQPFAAQYTRTHAGETLEVRVLTLFCAAMRRAVYETIGPLDERFGRGMFEDDDYAHRLRAAGLKLLCVEDVFVHHWGNASFTKLADPVYQQIFEENKRKFETKWGIEWEPHRYRQA